MNGIVTVTYDAIQLKSWASNGTATNYFFGPLFSAIWPENTGAFVVTVGGTEDAGIVPNMKIQEENRVENTVLGTDVDAEHDVFYYLEDSVGYRYTFKPEGVVSVSIANPILGANSASYNGFQNVPVNADSSYTMLLTHGRNIIKLTSASGASVYQVIAAKPAGYVISNKSRPGEPILPGDDVNVQYHGLFHPANKMSGIYNMSTYVTYNGTPAGNSLILSANQYQFGGTPSAQLSFYHVSTSCTDTFELRKGALQVLGFGSLFGKHREISIIGGVNPNFTAAVRVQYFGSIPNINIPITMPSEGFKFTGLPDSAEVFVISENYTAKNSSGADVTLKDTLSANENGEFLGTYRTYYYTIYAPGYKAISGTNTIAAGDGVKNIPVTMELIDGEWDGTNMAKPQQVTAAESTVTGSEFENKEGYYKITNAYELRWIAYQSEQKNAALNAILVNDIDLNNKSWSPIGAYAVGYNYTGTFEGSNKTIKGLLIDGTKGSSYKALFSFVNGGTVRNLTTEGNVTNGVASMFGGLGGSFLIENCHNKANISSTRQSTGGLVGSIMNTSTAQSVIRNCSNTGNVVLSGGNYQNTGGFAGGVAGAVTIENCWNSGNVTSPYRYVGGFAANMSNTATIKNCYNTGNISANGNNVGGMVGNATAGTILNCFNTGNITNANTAGYGAIKGAGTAATVTNCYAPDNIGNNIKTDGTSLKVPTAFASGEVTWLLGNAFGQTLGTDTIPVIGDPKVYNVTFTNNKNQETDTIFTNGTLPSLEKDGLVGYWFTNADQTTPVTNVNSDSILFLAYLGSNIPANIEINDTIIENGFYSCFNALQSIVVAANGNPVAFEQGSNIEIIAGQNIRFLPGFHAKSGSQVHAFISSTQFCTPIESPSQQATVEKCIAIVNENPNKIVPDMGKAVKIYPNPTSGKITVELTNYEKAAQINIYNTLGSKVYSTSTMNSVELNLSHLKKGLYVMSITSEGNVETKKVMVQ